MHPFFHKFFRAGVGLLALGLFATGGLTVHAEPNAQADPQVDSLNTLVFGGFRVMYPDWLANGVVITRQPGDPVETAQAGDSDAPHLRIELYDKVPVAGIFDLKGTIRLYRIEDINKYSFLMDQLDLLQKLLKEHPNLATQSAAQPATGTGKLPYIPVLTHSQMLHARVQYV